MNELRFSTILFDLDETLLNNVAGNYRFYAWLIDQLDSNLLQDPLTREVILQQVMRWNNLGIDDKRMTVYQNMLNKYPSIKASYSQMWDMTVNNGARFIEPFPATFEVLKIAKEKYKVGIVTNGDPIFQRLKLKKTGIDKLIDKVIVSGDKNIHKPDPAIYLEACELLGSQPIETLFIGDNFSTDIVGALNVGMDVCWVTPDKNQPCDLDIWRINNIKELINIL